MTMIGTGPVYDLMNEEAARRKARRDWAYQDEMRKLKEGDGMSSFRRLTPHPFTGEKRMAMWLADYFGRHRYGVQFEDDGENGRVWRAEQIPEERE